MSQTDSSLLDCAQFRGYAMVANFCSQFELKEFKRRKEEEELERQRQEELAKQSTLPVADSKDRLAFVEKEIIWGDEERVN